jgi:GT2 family glycosyltransferase
VSRSVLVSTRNRARLLARLLDSLRRQTVTPAGFELTIVDDGSEDATPAVIERARRDFPRLNHVRHERGRGLANAANRGAAAATGDRLLILDDDCVAAPDWVERLGEALREHPIVAGAVASPTQPFLTLCHNLSAFHGVAPDRPPGPVDFLAGANMGMTREAFDDVGGFERDRAVASDMDFVLRARERGYRIRFHPEALVEHRPAYVRAGSLLRYAFRHARGTIRLRHRHRELLDTPLVLRSAPLLVAASPAVALWRTLTCYARNPTLRRHPATAPVFCLLKLLWCLGAAQGIRDMQREP